MQIRLRDAPSDKPLVSESKDRSGFLDFIFFSDEANFNLSGHVIQQNMRFWTHAQPHKHQHRPLGVEKVTVCCALSRNGTIWPY